MPALDRYEEFLKDVPCDPTENPEFAVMGVGDAIPNRCGDQANWNCTGNETECTLVENWSCQEEVDWRSIGAVIPCDNPKGTPPATETPESTESASKYWWAILIGALVAVGMIALAVVVILRRRVVEDGLADPSP
jgi:hypothetical protein